MGEYDFKNFFENPMHIHSLSALATGLTAESRLKVVKFYNQPNEAVTSGLFQPKKKQMERNYSTFYRMLQMKY